MRWKQFRAIALMAAVSLLAVLPAVGAGAEGQGGTGDYPALETPEKPPMGLESLLFGLEGVFVERGLGEAVKVGELAGQQISEQAIMQMIAGGDDHAE